MMKRMALTEKQKGEVFIFSESIIWAFFPIITVLSYNRLPSLVALFSTMIFAAAFFVVIMTIRKSWAQLKNPLVWKWTLYITFFISVLFYGFYFIGLTKTTPGNASIVAVFEVFTTFLFFNVFKKEAISREHLLGAALLVIGAGIVLAPSFGGINTGDFLILAATFCAPAGNHFQQKVRKLASSETIMFLRSVLALPFIALLAYAFKQPFTGLDFRSSIIFLIINGVAIFGLSKIFWMEAIHRISVTKGIAISNMSPILTLFFVWLILGQFPTGWQLSSLVPTLLGVLFLTDQIRIKKTS
ncbi:MAG: DMT family transporter [bacterium]|nr:DMT family transporter [bacterium]